MTLIKKQQHIENIKLEAEPVIGEAQHGMQRVTIQIDNIWSNPSTFVIQGELDKNGLPKIDFYKNLHKDDIINITIEKTTHFYNNEAINVYHIIDIEKI